MSNETHVCIDFDKAKEYKTFLKATFGGITYRGYKLLAELLTIYKVGMHLTDVLDVIAEENNITEATAKLDLATYIKYINTQFTVVDLSNMFGYAPKDDCKRITTFEFILLLRDYLDTLEDSKEL